MNSSALADHDLRALNAALKSTDQLFAHALENELSAPPQRLVWASVHRTISSAQSGHAFNAQQFDIFDGHLQSSLFHHVPWESKSTNGLRENFAAIRYYIFTHANVSVAFESGIAQHLANTLLRANHWWNPFIFRLASNQAQPLGIGAQRLYVKLLERQNPYLKAGAFTSFLQQISGNHPMPWRLPPLAATPFSDWALRQPLPPAYEPMMEDLVDQFADMMDRYNIAAPEHTSQQLDALAEQIDAIEQTAHSYQSIDSLQEPTRRESIEIAKEILRKLKLALGQSMVGEGLNMDGTTDPFSILDALKGAVRVYEYHLHKVMQLDAAIMENPAVTAANQSIGKFGFIAKSMVLHTAKRLNDTRMVKVVKDQLMKMPKSWAPKPTERYSTLLNDLEGGLNTVLSRYQQLANKQGSTQFWLGFSNENTLGKADPSKNQAKAMADDAYYQQLNALRMQRAQQQQEMSNALVGQFKPASPDVAAQKGSNATPPRQQQPQQTRPSIPPIMSAQQQQPDPTKPNTVDSAVSQNQLASMRKSMATDANAEMVIVNQRQAQLRQMREQRQRQQQDQQRAARREQRQAARQAQAKEAISAPPAIKPPEIAAPEAQASAPQPTAASSISNASKNTKPEITDKKPQKTEKKRPPKSDLPPPAPTMEADKKIAVPPPPKKPDRSHGF